jgi:hypothetical protein
VRAFVDPFLRGWELDMALRYRPNALKFVYDRADIVDRNPQQGPITAHAKSVLAAVKSRVTVTTCVGFAKFPDPPTTRMERDTAVDIMFASFAAYLENRTQLGHAAYFCLTAIEERGGKFKKNRPAGAHYYSICMSVLSKIGNLTDNKGGPRARKAHGSRIEFTDKETRWLEEAMRVLIRRASEVAYDPTGSHRELTMADLPRID